MKANTIRKRLKMNWFEYLYSYVVAGPTFLKKVAEILSDFDNDKDSIRSRNRLNELKKSI